MYQGDIQRRAVRVDPKIAHEFNCPAYTLFDFENRIDVLLKILRDDHQQVAAAVGLCLAGAGVGVGVLQTNRAAQVLSGPDDTAVAAPSCLPSPRAIGSARRRASLIASTDRSSSIWSRLLTLNVVEKFVRFFMSSTADMMGAHFDRSFTSMCTVQTKSYNGSAFGSPSVVLRISLRTSWIFILSSGCPLAANKACNSVARASSTARAAAGSAS